MKPDNAGLLEGVVNITDQCCGDVHSCKSNGYGHPFTKTGAAAENLMLKFRTFQNFS